MVHLPQLHVIRAETWGAGAAGNPRPLANARMGKRHPQQLPCSNILHTTCVEHREDQAARQMVALQPCAQSRETPAESQDPRQDGSWGRDSPTSHASQTSR
ncbi:hypothetical protein I79_016949 [Cricetulus griseus]|uniref:Uncharacterized protein n=1 Tax=Cricetulus griseus TaxID=10029 RepID=G3I0R0_CRIGR|nr:hypothetical protein I79_016949 [Cricetulus griseus]